MNRFTFTSKFLIIAGFVVSVAVIFLLIVLKISLQQTGTDMVTESDETTLDQIIGKKGKPQSEEKVNASTYLYYSTESEDYKDIVALENNKVKFSIENVFDSSKGTLGDYLKKYGNPDIKMFDPSEEIVTWYIFLDEGLGVASYSDNEIAKLLYFQPQSRGNFMGNIASGLGLLLNEPVHDEQ